MSYRRHCILFFIHINLVIKVKDTTLIKPFAMEEWGYETDLLIYFP